MALKIQFTFVEGTTADVIVADASVSETHTFAADVTDYPVEEGPNVSDNIRARPIMLRVEAFLSDYPLRNEGRFQASSGGIPGFQRPASKTLASKDAFKKLQDLQTKGTLMTVETGIQKYENMSLENIEVPRDKSLKNGLRVTLSFKQVNVVKTQSSGLEKALLPKGFGRNRGGPQTSKTGDEALREKSNRLAENFNLGYTPGRRLSSGAGF